MKKRILVNGASGRIGKQVTFEILKYSSLELAALNDPVGIDEIIENYTSPDFTHGTLPWIIKKLDDETIEIDSMHKVKVYAEKDPAKMKIKENDIQIVEECSGFYVGDKKNPTIIPARAFLKESAERVVLSYPGNADAMIIMGVNHRIYDPKEHRVISNASCTTKSIAGPLQLLIDNGIEIEAFYMDTVHAATNSQRILESLNQIITSTTGASKATAKVIPELKGKMKGMAFRVPTTDGSFANMTFVANYDGELTKEKLDEIIEKHYNDQRYANRIALFYGEEAASANITGRRENAIILMSKTDVMPLPYSSNGKRAYLINIISGYDNEIGPPVDQTELTAYIST